MEREGERERDGENGKEGGTQRKGGRGERWGRDRLGVTDGQTLKNHLTNFQMGSAHANVYEKIDRTISRAKRVVQKIIIDTERR